MIRTKGEAGTGDIVNAVTHMRSVFGSDPPAHLARRGELYAEAKKLQAPYDLVRWVAENGRLPVVTFTAGGIATPADAALCMQLGADGVFVGSGIFKSGDPRAAREGDRRGDDALPGRGDPRPRLARPRRADGRHLDADARPERAARDARLVAAVRSDGAERPLPAIWPTVPKPRLERAPSFLRLQARLEPRPVALYAAIGARSAYPRSAHVRPRGLRRLGAAHPRRALRDRARVQAPRPLGRGRHLRVRVGDRLGLLRRCVWVWFGLAARRTTCAPSRSRASRSRGSRSCCSSRRRRSTTAPLPLPVHPAITCSSAGSSSPT